VSILGNPIAELENECDIYSCERILKNGYFAI
jgi:hypothetical protein